VKRKTEGARLAQEFPKFAQYISTELSVTELLPRRDGTDDDVALKMSSKDLDPAFEPAQTQETYGRGTDPIAYEHGTSAAGASTNDDGDVGHAVNPINEAFQAMQKDGFIIQTLRHAQPRKSAPEWMLTSLGAFIQSRLTARQRAIHQVPLRELVNFAILSDFYLEAYSDEQIFQHRRALIQRDRHGSRSTCSVKAVKARRERLVKAGNKLFGVDAQQHEENEPSCNNSRGIFRRLDSGAGGFFKTCAVLGCSNQGEASSPIVGVYICEQHPRSIQRKTRALQKLKTVSLPRMPYVEGSSPISP
jgi:hypothetical protein